MSAVFQSSAGVFAWLSAFINMEQGQTPKSFRLDRMKLLASLAGSPERCAPAIHIAGSKGKGSVAAMTGSVLEAAGYKTLRYLSPHVREYRERITRNGVFLDEAVYAEAGNELRSVAETAGQGKYEEFAGEGPTFFELLTLYFFLCARRCGCDVMVVETGMGGRLDSTNILDPLVSVITVIELEHTEFLGNTLPLVAAEKAGIVKPRRPLALARQEEEALEVFRKTAAEKGSPLIYIPEILSIENLRVHQKGTDFTLAFKDARTLDISLTVPGAIQAENAALAVTALNLAFPGAGEDALRRGLGAFSLPARFERIFDEPPLIIDGAHTEKSAALCAETFARLYGEGGILVFGCAAGKNIRAMAAALLPRFSRIIITRAGTFKINHPGTVFQVFAEAAGGTGPECSLMADTAEALEFALKLGKEQGMPVLATGSFYLAAEIRKLLKGQPL
jgi:dihydrofolate synthase/folylpolyglutamate synthase